VKSIDAGADAAQRVPPDQGRPQRDDALDFVKGCLVVVMVLYHAMNAFSNAGAEAYAYIRFVTGSFVLLSGYVVARYFVAPFQRDRTGTSVRLVLRGLKLLALFTVLNILIVITGMGNPAKGHMTASGWVEQSFAIYVTGTNRLPSFQILLPIAYVVIAGPLLLLLERHATLLLVGAVLATLAADLALWNWPNYELGVIGVLGFAAGLAAQHLHDGYGLRPVAVAVAGLAFAVLLAKPLNGSLLGYSLSTILIVKGCYDVGRAIDLSSRLASATILMGQFSLFCYVVQIVLLRGCARIVPDRMSEFTWPLVVITLATILILVGACRTIVRLSRRYAIVARSYRLVFA
jgi:hypothetical protein